MGSSNLGDHFLLSLNSNVLLNTGFPHTLFSKISLLWTTFFPPQCAEIMSTMVTLPRETSRDCTSPTSSILVLPWSADCMVYSQLELEQKIFLPNQIPRAILTEKSDVMFPCGCVRVAFSLVTEALLKVLCDCLFIIWHTLIQHLNSPKQFHIHSSGWT